MAGSVWDMFNMKTRSRLSLLGAGLSVTLVLAGCGSDKKSSSASGDASAPVANTCPGSAAKNHTFTKEPASKIDVSKTYTAVMQTTKGTIEFGLDAKRAPITVNSFVFLAGEKYFDCIGFHRVVPGFVLQGGDPNTLLNDPNSPPGAGGPGYEFLDELPQAGEYRFGSLAMANSGPNTNGSQFFIISGPQGEQLPPQYSLFGQATKGEDVIRAIDALGVPNADGPPTEPVTIISVRVIES